MTEDGKKILSRMQALCSRREYCSSEMLKKTAAALEKAGLDRCESSEILDSLRGDGFVDDARYASAFCREKSALTGWGPIKIRLALSARKIDGALIEAALASVDADRSRDRLRRLAEMKRKSLKGDPQAKLKLLRYLLSRGYAYDEVRQFAGAPDD